MFGVYLNTVREVYVENDAPQRFENVKVFAGSEWYPPLGVTYGGWIRNLRIHTGEETDIGQKLHPGI